MAFSDYGEKRWQLRQLRPQDRVEAHRSKRIEIHMLYSYMSTSSLQNDPIFDLFHAPPPVPLPRRFWNMHSLQARSLPAAVCVATSEWRDSSFWGSFLVAILGACQLDGLVFQMAEQSSREL